MRFICFLILIFSTDLFAGERDLPVGTFRGDSFSLEKNGVSILSNKDVHYNKSTLQITKVSSHIYDFTFAVYLQFTSDSKALTDTRIDRYKVIKKMKTWELLLTKGKNTKRSSLSFFYYPTSSQSKV